MKNFFATRLVVAAAVVALLLAFAVPASAAPATGADLGFAWSWSPASVFQWVQSLWSGWFGTGSAVEQQGSGMGNVYDQAVNALEPDGVRSLAPADGTTTLSDSEFGSF